MLNFCLSLFLLISLVNCFIPSTRMNTIAKFNHVPQVDETSRREMKLYGGKKAKFGIFSPAVYIAKLVLGESKLNKVRGKAISLHSQAITEWCKTYGAYNLRTRLIKRAKNNGDELGFLV